MKKRNLFQKKVNAPVRPTFRAMLVIDPQKLNEVQFHPIEGELRLEELALVLGILRDQCLIQFGVDSTKNETIGE